MVLQALVRSLKYRGSVEFSDESQIRKLIIWLEDAKIRFHKKDERGPLRDIDAPEWPAAIRAYLSGLSCPYSYTAESREQVAEWLLMHAIGLEYSDRNDEYNEAGSRLLPPADVDIEPYPGSHLASLRQTVDALADVLRCRTETDGLETDAALNHLRAVYEARLKPAREGKAALGPNGELQIQEEHFPLGFGTGDESLDRAATVLRMLYIRDLRGLQSNVDRALVAVQELTANPRTDSKLGRVGR